MKIHVHAGRVRLVSTCDEGSTVFEFRCKIEQQYSSLHPKGPPLASHALEDEDGYLIPDGTFVRDVLHDGGIVEVVMQRELGPVEGVDLTQVTSRWRYFQNYTLMAICEAPKEELTIGAVSILFEFLASSNQDILRKASTALKEVLEVRPELLDANYGMSFGRVLCSLALVTRDEVIQSNCAHILVSCLENSDVKPAFQGTGASNALIRLTRVDKQAIRAVATSGLWLISHSKEKISQERRIVEEEEKHGSRSSSTLSISNTVATLESSEITQVKIIALETLLRCCSDEAMKDFMAVETPRLLEAVKGICSGSSENSCIHELAADFLVEILCHEEILAYPLCQREGLRILVVLVEEYEAEAEEKSVNMPYSCNLQSICLNEEVKCPTKALVEILVQSASILVRKIVSEAILHRIQEDEDGTNIESFIPAIISAASQVEMQSAEETLNLAQILCRLSVRESCKPILIKYGVANFFVSLIEKENSKRGAGVMRAAAKGLANIASSSDEQIKTAVIRAVQNAVTGINTEDEIVAMYIEMLFTN